MEINDLFKETYDSLDAQDINVLDIESFIIYCESTYKMKTDVFLKWYEENEYEGNIDMQLWHQHCNHLYKGDDN